MKLHAPAREKLDSESKHQAAIYDRAAKLDVGSRRMIMNARATSWIARVSALRRLEVSSADLAIGTAGVFVAAIAVVSLAVDHREAGLGTAGGSWSLRGTLAPLDQPTPADGYALPLSSNEPFTGLS